jgi:hypothetical protein
MIYKKEANFPYPLLTNTSSSYKSCRFKLEDVNLEENIHHYKFELKYDINSEFIIGLLKSGQAQLVLVIQSKDNKFYNLNFEEYTKEIHRSRISLSKRTTIQLLIQSREEISFKDNNELSSFYEEFKNDIVVPKNSILGFSNSVTFEGSSSKPFDLFEKKVDPSLNSDIKIELGSETIIINYKSEQLQFNDLRMSPTLNNPYVYMGLQKALLRFIVNNSTDEGKEEVNLDDIEVPIDSLDFKLYNLMKKKMVNELSVTNIDEVIYSITDKVIEKYTAAIRGLSSSGN